MIEADRLISGGPTSPQEDGEDLAHGAAAAGCV